MPSINPEPGPQSALLDLFKTAAGSLGSTRNCEPAGTLNVTGGATYLSVSGGKLVCSGGAAAWGNPLLIGAASRPRGRTFESTFRVTASGHFVALGWSNAAAPGSTLADITCAWYPVNGGNLNIRDVLPNFTQDVNAFQMGQWLVNTDYGVRITTFPGGGYLIEMTGGCVGSAWTAVAWSKNNTDATVYESIYGYDAPFTAGPLRVSAARPTAYPMYFNAGDISINPNTAYSIKQAVSLDGITAAQPVHGSVLTAGTGWEAYYVKDQNVLYDAGTWKMWYTGINVNTLAGVQQIGYATSTDGKIWTKSGSNPVLTPGSAGAFDEKGCLFPFVWKDNGAPAGKRYRMLYAGLNASGVQQIGYAYSADGVAWTKGGANPVIPVGAGGAWDSAATLLATVAYDSGTYYCYYGGTSSTSFPAPFQVGLVTFTDFEGTYTKAPGNPVLANRPLSQVTTADTLAGSAVVKMASTVGFVANECVILVDNSNPPTNVQQNRIKTVDSGTQVTLWEPVFVNFLGGSTYFQSLHRAVTPKTVVKEGSAWKMWGASFQTGGAIPTVESTFYATSTAPDSGWTIDHPHSPNLWLPDRGRQTGTGPRSSENPAFVLDAATGQRYQMTL